MEAVSGVKELEAMLNMLHKSSAYRAIKAGSAKSMQVAAKAIKNAVPSQYKEARKGIRWRAGKGTRGFMKNVFRARAGVAVGIKRAKLKALGQQQKLKREKSARPGVGIGPSNIQWMIMGTKNRVTRSGRRTGSTKPELPKLVDRAVRPVQGQMLAAHGKAAWASIRKDLARGRAF